MFIKFYIIFIFIFIINCSGNKVSNYHGTKLLEAKYNEIAGWGFVSVGLGFFAIAWVFNALKGRV